MSSACALSGSEIPGTPKRDCAIVINITNVRWNFVFNFIPLPPSFTDR